MKHHLCLNCNYGIWASDGETFFTITAKELQKQVKWKKIPSKNSFNKQLKPVKTSGY